MTTLELARCAWSQAVKAARNCVRVFLFRKRTDFVTKYLDDVITVGAFNRLADLANFHGESGIFKFGNHLAFCEPAQIPTFIFAACIDGILGGKGAKIGAGCKLCADILGSCFICLQPGYGVPRPVPVDGLYPL